MAEINPVIEQMQASGDIAGLTAALKRKGMQFDAATALTKMGPAGIAALVQALKTQNGIIRVAYAAALKKAGEPVVPALLQALDDPRLSLGAAATFMLMADEIHTEALQRQTAEALTKHSSDFRPDRQFIVEALGKIGAKLKSDKALKRRIGETLARMQDDPYLDNDDRKKIGEAREMLGFDALPLPDTSQTTCPKCRESGKVTPTWVRFKNDRGNLLFAPPRMPFQRPVRITTVMLIAALIALIPAILLTKSFMGVIYIMAGAAAVAALLYYGYLKLAILNLNPLTNAVVQKYEQRKKNWDDLLHCEACDSVFYPADPATEPLSKIKSVLNRSPS